jgi:hypothetical protein
LKLESKANWPANQQAKEVAVNEYLVVLVVLLFFVLRFVVPVAVLVLLGYAANRLENRFFFPAAA